MKYEVAILVRVDSEVRTVAQRAVRIPIDPRSLSIDQIVKKVLQMAADGRVKWDTKEG